MDFLAKLTAAVAANRSLLCVGLDPVPEQMPSQYRDQGGDLLRSLVTWNRAVIGETADLVCAYKPNIAFYEALGMQGMELLQETLSSIPATIPVILDAKRGDMENTAAAYARACFQVWQADAVTLSPYLGRDSIMPFAAYPGKGLFVLCHTSNPSALDFQTLPVAAGSGQPELDQEPLYLTVAKVATSWSPQVGLVVGATYPMALAAIRTAVPAAWILVPGIGAQGGELAATIRAGLREDGLGLIVSASRSISQAHRPGQAAADLRQAMRTEQERVREQPVAGPPIKSRQDRTEGLSTLALALADLQAVRFGTFTLASGQESPIYVDLRLLVGRPDLLRQVARAYADLLTGLPCHRVAGVPYAALPIGTALSLTTGVPLIYPRKEAKAHGLGKEIEGVWQPGERVVIIEDLITSGGNILKSAGQLRAAGLVVEDAIVLIDREQGGVANLAAAGIAVHAVFRLSEILESLVQAGRLDQAKQQEVLRFIGSPQ